MKLELVDLIGAVVDENAKGGIDRDQLAVLVDGLGCREWELNLVLVDDGAMADLNVRHYGGEGVTDVLSFSYLETEGSGMPQLTGGENGAARSLWLPATAAAAPALAGEVVLAFEYVRRRCRDQGWDLATEVVLLLVHGALHVLGWRHDDPRQADLMRAREADILAANGWRHPLLPPETEN